MTAETHDVLGGEGIAGQRASATDGRDITSREGDGPARQP